MTPTLYIMCGAGFAGKSTLAKRIAEHTGAVLVSLDALYFEKEKELEAAQMNSDQQWELLLKLCKAEITKLLFAGKSVVFDNTNVRFSHRQELRDIVEKNQATSAVIYLNTPTNVLVERQMHNKVSKERHDVEQHYLDQALNELEPPTTQENVREFTPQTDINSFLESLNS